MQEQQNEINDLLDKGQRVKIGRMSFTIKKPKLGTLIYLSDLFIKNSSIVDESKENLNPRLEGNKLVFLSAKNMAKAVAISILNSRIKIKLFSRILTKLCIWNMTTQQLKEAAFLIAESNDLANFIISVRATAGVTITKSALETEQTA